MRIVGNLDVEVTWARMDAASRLARGEKAPSPDDPRFALPEPVMRKISAAATLLRVFAHRDDDVVWTPRPVDAKRMADVSWLPRPVLESGPVPADAEVWWGQPTELAARLNHRSFVLTTPARRGSPDESVVVRSVDELAIRARGGRPWVAKAPLSAAGRLRVRGDGGALAPQSRRQAEELLALYGCLVFEQWFARTADLGVVGSRCDHYGGIAVPHLLHTDANGRFLGITVGPGDGASEDVRVIGCALEAADALHAAGWVGPFGVDLFLVVRCGGGAHVQLSEINVRHTFGHVANALALGARAFLALEDAEPVTLRFGRAAPPDGTIPLLLPGTDDDTSAWLEVVRRHGS